MPKAKPKRQAKRLTSIPLEPISKRPTKSSPKIITLYAPSIDITIPFTFTSSQPSPTILAKIRTALGTPVAFAYDLQHRPVTNYTRLQAKQTLLIATSFFERPLDDKKRSVLVVQDGPAEKAWLALTADEKRDYIQVVRNKDDPLGRDAVRLTLPVSGALQHFTRAQTPSSLVPVKAHLESIQKHWSLPLDAVLGLQGLYMPCEQPETWQDGLVGMLAVLSEATVGQGDLLAAWMLEQMRRGKGKIVEKRDVEEVGRRLYREALG
ncbi:hypothetical protein BDU57DRAFT_374575 [Ampelomyces quisqualis]|uniref:Uncharacterized protein n=1 Tax=Ampelomyces quisqualis TaxID=50730 RepID=A0A6A5QBE9_AMPQU|nr:hypothetical protein BDU57DRAFT_374575 [Ampelomyces quisqualis]